MSDKQIEYDRILGMVLGALWKDRVLIVVFAGAFAVLGAALGKLTNTATATSSLLLTPLALQQQTGENKVEDSLSKMLSEPLDVTTVSLMCKSDQTLSFTMNRLNESGGLKQPIEDLNKLSNALDFKITVSKDTPYLTEYSPILQLKVNWGNSAEAKLIADTWAEVCVERAEDYRNLQQSPAAEAFEEQRTTMDRQLETAEGALEAFLKENNVDYVLARIEHLTGLSTEYLKRKYDTETDLAAHRAMADTMRLAMSGEVATRKLQWRPSGKLMGLVDIPKDGGGSEDNLSALDQEVINPVYDFMRERLTIADSSVAELDARLHKISSALESYDLELKALQEEHARLTRTRQRLSREVEIMETAYKDAATKNNYAIMASSLKQPVLHVFSEAAEWRMPRFRRAILFGVSAGIFAFGMAAGLSLMLRMVVMPAMRHASYAA